MKRAPLNKKFRGALEQKRQLATVMLQCVVDHAAFGYESHEDHRTVLERPGPRPRWNLCSGLASAGLRHQSIQQLLDGLGIEPSGNLPYTRAVTENLEAEILQSPISDRASIARKDGHAALICH